jgi:hypothetical protein
MSLPKIESDIHKAVLGACRESEIDIRTPILLHQIND